MQAIAITPTGAAGMPLTIPPPPPQQPVQWLRAVRALLALLDDPEQTEKAFEIFQALDGGHTERFFQRLVADPQGRKLVADRPELIERLADRSALAALPDDTFGRAYLAYLERNGLDPTGLIRLKSDMEARAQTNGEDLVVLDAAREWFRVRGILTHDLWHVLTDYGTDGLGEAALLAFSQAQAPGRANRLLVVGTAVRGTLELGPGFLRYLVQAWRRGKHAAWLPALPYEDLLAQPLAAVRAYARIEPPEVAHPGGILRGPWNPSDVAGPTTVEAAVPAAAGETPAPTDARLH